MKANSIHSQNPPSTTPPLSASQSTANSTKRYNSITDSLNYFNIYGSTNELIPSSINYICIYTLVEDTGEDIYKQILYYGTEETFRFEAKGGDNRKRSDALSLDLFKKDETSKVSEERVDNSNDNKGGNSDIEDNEEDRGANLRPRHGTPIEIQERQVGLAQAIVNFSKTFSDTDISDNIHSQKHRLIIIEPEPKYFMVLSINLGQKLRNSNTQKGSLVVDYLDYELDDNLLKSWLTKSYQSFCIGHGDFSTIFNSQGKQSLVHNLEHFYDLYFSKHQSFTNLNLLKSLNKLELLYLSKSNYLYLKQIYNQLTSLNQRIDDSFIIFKGKLILNEFFTTNVSDPVIQYYSELFGEDFEFSEEMGHDGRNYGSVGGGNRQSMFQSWNPFKRYSTTSTSSTSVYSPNFQFLNLWDTTSADGDSEDSQYFKPQYLTNYDPKSPLQFNLQSKLMPETSSIVKKFYYNNGSEKLALIYSFAPHSYLVLTYNQDTSPYLTQGYFEDLERLLQPILNDTLVQLLQKDYELYQEQKGELTTKKLEFFYWNLLNNVKEINFTNTLINNDDFRLVIEVIDKLKSQKTTNDLIVRTISKKRTLTNWILGKRINNEESILILVVQRDSNIGDVEEEFRKLMNCYFNHLFLD